MIAIDIIRRRSLDTFQAMETLAGHLAGIGGRKTVVWVSEAFALPTGLGRAEMLYRLHRATEALSHAQASLYPVDARGLVGSHSIGPRALTGRFRRIEVTVRATVPLALALPDEARAAAVEQGLVIERRVTLDPKVLQLRIVARDVPTGRVGSLVMPARLLAIR